MTVTSALGQPLDQPILAVVVEQEADRAAIHAVDRDAAAEMVMHGLQHEPVAAERDDGVGVVGRGVAVALDERGARLIRLWRVAGDEGDGIEGGHDHVDALGACLRSGHYKCDGAPPMQVPHLALQMVNPWRTRIGSS